MRYDFQLIVLLSTDDVSVTTYQRLQTKRQDAGDLYRDTGETDEQGRRVVAQVSHGVDFSSFAPGDTSAVTYPGLTNQSRIYVIGHGNPESTHIGIENGRGWSPDQVAGLVRSFIPRGVQIARLSIMACYGGGNQHGEDVPAPIAPRDSFALRLYQLVHECVRSVSARTASCSAGRQHSVTGDNLVHNLVTNQAGQWAYRPTGSKVVFSNMIVIRQNLRSNGACDIQHTWSTATPY